MTKIKQLAIDYIPSFLTGIIAFTLIAIAVATYVAIVFAELYFVEYLDCQNRLSFSQIKSIAGENPELGKTLLENYRPCVWQAFLYDWYENWSEAWFLKLLILLSCLAWGVVAWMGFWASLCIPIVEYKSNQNVWKLIGKLLFMLIGAIIALIPIPGFFWYLLAWVTRKIVEVGPGRIFDILTAIFF